MREKLALVIAALMITSMAFAISTTSVTAGVGDSLSPTSARANTRVKFTVTVKNDSTTDNIDNIRIIAPSGSGFTQVIGYEENLKIAAENMENAVSYLQQAGDNLILAEDNKKSSGPNIKAAGDNLGTVTDGMLAAENASSSSAARTNVLANLTNALSAFQLVADAIDDSIENLVSISAQLTNAGNYLRLASGVPTAPPSAENMENIKGAVAENLDNAGADLVTAATSLASGDLETAGSYIKDAGDNLVAVASGLSQASLVTIFNNAGSQLQTAGNKLIDAGNFLDNAGYALGVAENYLTSAGDNLSGATNLTTAGNNLKIAASLIENAGIAIQDNVLRAGDNLKLASDNLENVALEIGVALGGDEENAAAVHIDHAADNLTTAGTVGLTTAGEELKNAASNLSAAASEMLSTTNALGPTTWTITEPTAAIQFNAILDNVIVPGGSQTFVFLWTTPNISIENTYTITIASNKEGGGAAHWIIQDTQTLTVDGKIPTLTIVVTQAGVADNNVVGTALDNAQATITITASETLQSIGTVYVENAGQPENFLPPITLTTTDNIVFTGTFTAGAWDDNTCRVRVTSAKDLAGNENTVPDTRSFTVDTRAPVFVPPENSGLSTLVSGMVSKTQAGTGTTYTYVDNTTSHSIIIRVEDNVASTDNDVYVISVTVNTTSATRSAVVENLWSLDPLTLSEGLTTAIVVTATDRTGNTISENIENIFIDAQAPTIEFNTVAGKTWDENGELINDSTPEIKVTITDPGYPTSGLGIANENLDVYLDNDDNINNGTPAAPYGSLENKVAWDPSTGVFENLIDNAGSGLVDGTYWIIVRANDNLVHAAADNENWAIAKQSFIVDTTAPGTPSIDTAYDITSTMDEPKVVKSASRTIGGTAEVGATITVYGTVDTTETVLGTATAGLDGKWTVTFTLTAGSKTKIEVSATDMAGNEGSRTLYGWMLADASAPIVTLATLPETTDKSSITISGTVTKDTWEDWSDITLTVQVGTGRVEVPIGAGGTYGYSLELAEGSNTIVVQATDEIGNASVAASAVVERTVTPWAIYAIILVIVALVLAAIAIFREPIFGRKK